MVKQDGVDTELSNLEIEDLGYSQNHKKNQTLFDILEAKYDIMREELKDDVVAEINPFRHLGLYEAPSFDGPISFDNHTTELNLKSDAYYCDIVDYDNLKNDEGWLKHEYVVNDYPFGRFLSFN